MSKEANKYICCKKTKKGDMVDMEIRAGYACELYFRCKICGEQYEYPEYLERFYIAAKQVNNDN